MRLFVTIFVLTIFSVALSGCSLRETPASQQSAPPEVQVIEEIETESKKSTLPSYTLDDIASHKAKDDCWMSIAGKVYDVTPVTSAETFSDDSAILKGCGTDATKLVGDTPTDTEKQSEQTQLEFENYLIGDLEQ